MRHVGRDFESQFGDTLNTLRRHASAVDQMAIATELEQAAKYRQKSERVYHHDLQIRCSEWLQPSNFREVLTRQLNERLEGTCEWILDNPDFKSWSSTSETVAGANQLLLICGNPVRASSPRISNPGPRMSCSFLSQMSMQLEKLFRTWCVRLSGRHLLLQIKKSAGR